MNAAIILWLVTAAGLYISTLLAYDRVLENASGVVESPGKVLEFFVTKRVGTLLSLADRRRYHALARAGLRRCRWFRRIPGELWSSVIYPYSAYSAKLNVDGQLVPKFEWKETDGHDRLQVPGSKYVIDFVVARRFFGTVYVCCII